VNLGAGVNTAGFEGGPSYFENEDVGTPQLYFNHNPAPVNAGGDIYLSEQATDGSFGPAAPVVELNSPASDQRPSIAHNGLEIYFFSDRPGSSSDDIWVSTRKSVLAPWSSPTNLGPPINTGALERHPLIVSHGATEYLYFARNVATPPAIDLDLFVSTRTRRGTESDQVTFEIQAQSFANSEWSEPVSLGATINSTFNEQAPSLSPDGLSLYFGLRPAARRARRNRPLGVPPELQ
jgi:hypothetical protein